MYLSIFFIISKMGCLMLIGILKTKMHNMLEFFIYCCFCLRVVFWFYFLSLVEIHVWLFFSNILVFMFVRYKGIYINYFNHLVYNRLIWLSSFFKHKRIFSYIVVYWHGQVSSFFFLYNYYYYFNLYIYVPEALPLMILI